MFKVKVTYTNGNVNTRVFEEREAALESYNKTKERHYDTNCKIEFIQNDSTMWGKRCSTIEEDLRTSLQEKRDELAIIEGMGQHFFDKVGFLTKERDNILHVDFEHSKGDSYTNEEKLDTFSNLREVQLLRREYKHQRDLYNSIEEDIYEAKKALERAIYKVKQAEENAKDRQEYFENNTSNKHKIHKFPYKDNREMNELNEQLKREFSRVMIDTSNKEILCYNNCASR